jgi:hypothetical protein
VSVDTRSGTERAAGAATDGPAAAAASLLSNTLSLARHVVELAAAELRLAALSGVTMLMLVIVTALLIVMAWGFVAAVAAYGLVAVGLPWPAAGLLIAAVHGGAAYLLWRSVVKLSRSLTLPELRRTVLSSED